MSRAEVFDRNSPLLSSIAYGMTCSFESFLQQEERLMEGFLQASLSGDMEALLELLSDDVTLYSDGGRKTRAALRPVYGADDVARFLTGILRNIPPGFAVKQTSVNGWPGLVGYFTDGSPQSVVTLEVFEGSIRAVRLVVNPEKLGNVPPLEREEDSR